MMICSGTMALPRMNGSNEVMTEAMVYFAFCYFMRHEVNRDVAGHW